MHFSAILTPMKVKIVTLAAKYGSTSGFTKLTNLPELVLSGPVSFPFISAQGVLHKGEFTIPPLFDGCEVLLSAFNKENLLTDTFSKSSNFNGSKCLLTCFSFNN